MCHLRGGYRWQAVMRTVDINAGSENFGVEAQRERSQVASQELRKMPRQ